MKDHTTANKLLTQTFQAVRNKTEELCRPLTIEDYVIQSIEDVSPPKWHLAHTTWFFETFLLIPELKNYQIFHPLFHQLFNSYYHSIGHPYPRARRGLLSRPTVETIYSYREYVNQHVSNYLEQLSDSDANKIESIIKLGLNHEQQHQELLMMDIKHNFSIDPNFPVYHLYDLNNHLFTLAQPEFAFVEGGVVEIGYPGKDFCFDNELPRHQLILKPYQIATRLVTNAEYCEFIAAQGYLKPEWWLSDGWECAMKNRWQAPLYWHQFDNKWYIFTLGGLRELDPAEPVSHVSYYEADAYARWRGFRLPTEAEWEHYVTSQQLNPENGNFLENNIFHPQTALEKNRKVPQQLFGDLWEWTASPYISYPGYQPPNGALGEYNGKFMSNQMVLRGGCCVTPQTHLRASYRNFFQPDKRWQFSGIRLAKEC